MNAFFTSLNAVLSVFLLIAIGYITRIALKLDKNVTKKFNQVVYYVLMPILVAENMMNADIQTVLPAKLALYVFFGLFIAFLACWLLFSKIEKNTSVMTVIVQAAFRGNYLIMVLPLLKELFPGENLALASALIIVVTPTYAILSTILFERYREEKVNTKQIIVGVLKNPLFVGVAVGFLIMVSNVSLPHFLASAVKNISSSTSTIALLVLGMRFEFGSIRREKKSLLAIILLRLIIVPAVFLPLAALLGFRGMEFAVLIPVFGSPVAVASYSIAAELGGDADLAANAIAITTAVSVFTMFLWIFVFLSAGVF